MSNDENAFDVYPPEENEPEAPQADTVLSEVVARLVRLEQREATRASSNSNGEGEGGDGKTAHRPATWVHYPPPDYDPQNPRGSLIAWVDWYNTVYVGRPETTPAIPPCWQQHPGLVAELATLAATWREANLGKGANARDAQYWHHVWRTGTINRLLTDWVHPYCTTGEHRTMGASPPQ